MNRRGQKPKGPFRDKRRTLSTRITEETRERLEGAARASGRSLSQEIEFRLGNSFRDDEIMRRLRFIERMQAKIAKGLIRTIPAEEWRRLNRGIELK